MSENRIPAFGRDISVCVPFKVRKAWPARWWWTPIIFLSMALRSLALDPAEPPATYIAAHWDTEDGLPHNLVRCIFQTRDGYLWVGTQQGLARFDGLAFTVFNHHN